METTEEQTFLYPIAPQSYKIHVDASYDSETKVGRLAWVIYIENKLITTNITTHVRRKSANALEQLVFKIANQIYSGAQIYTDSQSVWKNWKGKNKNRIYLIDHNDNLADNLLRGEEIPSEYPKPSTYKFEYIRVKEDVLWRQVIDALEAGVTKKQRKLIKEALELSKNLEVID